jgi:hypothetical protein
MTGYNPEKKAVLFPEGMPRIMCLINVMAALLLMLSFIIAVMQGIFFMRPRVNCWNFLNLGPKREYLMYISFTYEALWKTGLVGFVFSVCISILNFAYAIRGKLDWNACLTWFGIHSFLLVIAFLGFLSWDGVIP